MSLCWLQVHIIAVVAICVGLHLKKPGQTVACWPSCPLRLVELAGQPAFSCEAWTGGNSAKQRCGTVCAGIAALSLSSSLNLVPASESVSVSFAGMQVPEGLLPTVTISLMIASDQMATRNVIWPALLDVLFSVTPDMRLY